MLDRSLVRRGLIYPIENGEAEEGETCPRCFLLSTPCSSALLFMVCVLLSLLEHSKFVKGEGVRRGS